MPLTERKSILAGPEYGFTGIQSIDYPDVLMPGQSGITFFDIPEMNNRRRKGIEMPENIENVKEKIGKLLALSKSDNGNEAAAALQKAFELTEKYDLLEIARIFWPEIYALRKMEKTVEKTQRKGL